jgi:hypothetical protein
VEAIFVDDFNRPAPGLHRGRAAVLHKENGFFSCFFFKKDNYFKCLNLFVRHQWSAWMHRYSEISFARPDG